MPREEMKKGRFFKIIEEWPFFHFSTPYYPRVISF